MAKKQQAPQGASGAPQIRNRIRELKNVRAADLIANPLNWRAHPEQQRTAMTAILAEVGMVDALLVREVEGGQYEIIDGHMRAALMPHEEVPCLVLDVTPEEATKVLLTFDPLAAMAEANSANLDALLREVEFGEAALQELVSGLAEKVGLYDQGQEPETEALVEDDGQYTGKVEAPIYTPKGERPAVSELTDRTKAEQLCVEIQGAELPEDIKAFLMQAAQRHVVYNFRNIAEFYCHAPAGVQHLMERSGLIIIDFDKAIQNGFVHMTERLGKIADIEKEARGDGNA